MRGGGKMPTTAEIKKDQNEKLHDLLVIKKNPKKLDEIISRTRAGMSKEEIAWVEKEVDALDI
jgi:hypothetical protein